jgi:hypothetical protein
MWLRVQLQIVVSALMNPYKDKNVMNNRVKLASQGLFSIVFITRVVTFEDPTAVTV